MKRSAAVPWFLLAAVAGLTGPARAEICAVDNTPAATLLLPYFEVALPEAPKAVTRRRKVNTLLTVNNTAGRIHKRGGVDLTPMPVLAHVVVWSDLSVPVLDFNLYLTSYDVQSINLYDVLVLGRMPQTASAGQDPADLISPRGAFSGDVNFASCNGQLPPPDLPPTLLAHVQAALTGKASPIFGGLCAGRDLGDGVLRGYVTVDTVSNCTLRFPGDPGYFGGDATDDNVLWGDYFYVDADQNVAQGETLVHVEASATDPQTSTPGQYTFYGRYVAWTAADHREPLSTSFAVRYANGGAFTGGTSLLVWRDSKVAQTPFPCPAPTIRPTPWYPLGQEAVTFFDEEENPFAPTTFPVSPQPPQASILPFPAEAQRVEVGGPDLPIDFPFGWVYLNLNTSVAAAGNNPPEDPFAAQAWVTAVLESQGRFSVGFDAIQLDSACTANHVDPGP